MTATKEQIRVARRTIAISNRDKVLFPDDGITKGDLIAYYTAIAPAMLPWVRGRPLTMERYPDGIDAERVFQKNISKYFPDWIARAEVGKKGGSVTHVLAQDAPTMAYLANQAVVTHHVWLSTTDRPHTPDQMIFDLDPSREDFGVVRATALRLRDLLVDIGMVPFVKTSGSRGLHIVVPLRPAHDFGVVHGVAEGLARRLIDETPDELTLEFHKAERGGRIYMDIGRNAYAQTAVAPFTVRARPGAPVAVPLEWGEVEAGSLEPGGFGMADALARARSHDPWRGFRRAARTVAKAQAAITSMIFLGF